MATTCDKCGRKETAYKYKNVLGKDLCTDCEFQARKIINHWIKDQITITE